MNLEEKINLIIQIIGGLVVIFTAVAQSLGRTKWIERAGKIQNILNAVIKFMPTIGVNPRVKK